MSKNVDLAGGHSSEEKLSYANAFGIRRNALRPLGDRLVVEAGDDRWPEHVLGMIVGGRYLSLVQEHQPLAVMRPHMVVQAVQFRTQTRLPQVGSEPVIQAVLDLLHAAAVACGREFVAPAGQLDGFLEQAAQGRDLGLFLGRDRVVKLFAAA